MKPNNFIIAQFESSFINDKEFEKNISKINIPFIKVENLELINQLHDNIVPTVSIIDDLKIIENKLENYLKNNINQNSHKILKYCFKQEQTTCQSTDYITSICSESIYEVIKSLSEPPYFYNKQNIIDTYETDGIIKNYKFDFIDDINYKKEIINLIIEQNIPLLDQLKIMYKKQEYSICLDIIHKTKTHFNIFGANTLFLWMSNLEKFLKENKNYNLKTELAIELINFNAKAITKQLYHDFIN